MLEKEKVVLRRKRSRKVKIGNKSCHGNKRHLSVFIMHINANGELHTLQNPRNWIKSSPTN